VVGPEPSAPTHGGRKVGAPLPLPVRQPQRCLPGSRHLWGERQSRRFLSPAALLFWPRPAYIRHRRGSLNCSHATRRGGLGQTSRRCRSYCAEPRAALPLLDRADDRITTKLLQCMGPLLALSGHSVSTRQCPLLGVKRTWRLTVRMSAFDPKRTSSGLTFCSPVC
jgi:hypothetical protein